MSLPQGCFPPNKALVGVAGRPYHLRLEHFLIPGAAEVNQSRPIQWDFGPGDVRQSGWNDTVERIWSEPGVYEIKIRYYSNFLIHQEIRKVRIGLLYESHSDPSEDARFEGMAAYVMKVQETSSAPTRLVALLFKPQDEEDSYDRIVAGRDKDWDAQVSDEAGQEDAKDFGEFAKRIEQCFVAEVLGKALPDPRALDEGIYGVGARDILYYGTSDDLRTSFQRLKQRLIWDYTHPSHECNPAPVYEFARKELSSRPLLPTHPFRPFAVVLPEGDTPRTGAVVPNVEQERTEETEQRQPQFEDLFKVASTDETYDPGLAAFGTLETIFEVLKQPPEGLEFGSKAQEMAFDGFLKLVQWWRRIENACPTDPKKARDESFTWMQSTYHAIYGVVEDYVNRAIERGEFDSLEPPMVIVSLNCEDLSLGVRFVLWNQNPAIPDQNAEFHPGLVAWRHVFVKLSVAQDDEDVPEITLEHMYHDRAGELKTWPAELARTTYKIDTPEKAFWTKDTNFRLNPLSRRLKDLAATPREDLAGMKLWVRTRALGGNLVPVVMQDPEDVDLEYVYGMPVFDWLDRDVTDTQGLGNLQMVQGYLDSPGVDDNRPWRGLDRDPGEDLGVEEDLGYVVHTETGRFMEEIRWLDARNQSADLKSRVMQVQVRPVPYKYYPTNPFGTEVGVVHKIVEGLRNGDRVLSSFEIGG